MSAWTKWTCTKSSSFSQFLTFYYCCTIYTSTYNFECINFHIIFLFVFEWTCGVEIAVVTHGMKISTVVAMDADWEIIFFFHLTKKTGLQVHPTTDMQVTESREEEKVNQVTHNAPQLFVAATVWQVLGGKRCVSAGWNWNAGKWMAEMNKYIHLYLHICKGGNYKSTVTQALKLRTILGC